jgi:hypothetical protein
VRGMISLLIVGEYEVHFIAQITRDFVTMAKQMLSFFLS